MKHPNEDFTDKAHHIRMDLNYLRGMFNALQLENTITQETSTTINVFIASIEDATKDLEDKCRHLDSMLNSRPMKAEK